jgi:7-carboxy-7-deazaguanine synthase
MSEVAIAEQFYSIQGEGPHAGTPAIFLRLAGCNFSCGWNDDLDEYEPGDDPQGEAEWVCDTIDVWRAAKRRVEPKELVEGWKAEDWLGRLHSGAHIVLTGGEPMLPAHQDAFHDFYLELLGNRVRPFVEVETNGSIEPDPKIVGDVNQWNVSLKLSNSGMEMDKRINEDAIEQFIDIHKHSKSDATFKFVVADEDNVHEILELQNLYDIPKEMMMLMPAGQTQEQLRETYGIVAEVCKDFNWQFSPRLQVDAWGQVTGV